MEVKWAQFAKVVLEIIVSLSRFFSYRNRIRFLHSSHSRLIIPFLACYELASGILGLASGSGQSTEPGSVGDISGSCTSEYGKHQVPFAFELYLDQ